ncbi:MAG: hypothetical protein JWM04_167, partial [Verrucomicrobiales bacterium]|nr:hypothetical protein [Verrucomicrobiales bacterium]
ASSEKEDGLAMRAYLMRRHQIDVRSLHLKEETGQIFATGTEVDVQKLQSVIEELDRKEATNADQMAKEAWIKDRLQFGKQLYQTGQPATAKEVFLGVVALYPQNVPALQYLEWIQEGRPPVLPTGPRGRLAEKGRSWIIYKLENIAFSEVKFDRRPLTEVLNLLTEKSRDRDPDQKGIYMGFAKSTGPEQYGGKLQAGSDIYVSVDEHDLSMDKVLVAIVKGASKPISFEVEDFGVVVQENTKLIPSLPDRE